MPPDGRCDAADFDSLENFSWILLGLLEETDLSRDARRDPPSLKLWRVVTYLFLLIGGQKNTGALTILKREQPKLQRLVVLSVYGTGITAALSPLCNFKGLRQAQAINPVYFSYDNYTTF